MKAVKNESFICRFRDFVIGIPRDIRDPHIFHKLSIVAFLAWVGLGSDGLSSCCYGPEEAFLALKSHMFLGVFVAIATAVTIFVISSSYSQIIELFPNGGGGYLVASKLLSPSIGMVSGCALLIDYVLTITISVASGTDAIFSFLPMPFHSFKLVFAISGIVILTILNMRGVKESIMPIVPIFILFIATHVFVIIYGIVTHLSDFGSLATTTMLDIKATSAEIGVVGMIMLIMRAYSMGAGTFTGIEAVSNGMPILREPKVKTAKKTMAYMALSLAFMAAGLMIGYLLYRVGHQPGKTLNALLFERVASGWNGHVGYVFVLIALISEAILLFVAAQTGFLDGPRVLASMAYDRWFPLQFSLLSERFVAHNGILLMSGAAIALMILSKGSVQFLVVLYSINVFITFFLSQLGMVRYWWKLRHQAKAWMRKISINGIGLILTGFILISVLVIKFHEGGWITIFITGTLVSTAILCKRYYYRTRKLLVHLDALIHATEISKSVQNGTVSTFNPKLDKESKIAVILVNGFNGMGLHTLFNVKRLFGEFRNFFFVQAGIIDAGNFKGIEEIDKLKKCVKQQLGCYVSFMRRQGFHAEAFSAIGTDVAEEIVELSKQIFESYPQSVFFGGQIVFTEDSIFTKMLYNHTTFAVQRRLHQKGIPFFIMPTMVRSNIIRHKI